MRKSFQKLQYQFAAHLRSPDKNPPPEGLDEQRLAIYRKLFFKNISRFISNSFPVLKKFYAEEVWQALIRKFYARHRNYSPYFAEVSREFLDYLKTEHRQTGEDPPFMNELAHYEWIEVELARKDEEIDFSSIDPEGNLLDGSPVLSPLARLLTYRWPVHRISPDFRPKRPGKEPTCLVVCRNRDDKIIFVHVNPTTSLLLDKISNHPEKSGREHIEELACSCRLPDPDAAVSGGLETLTEMHRQEIILGTWKTRPATKSKPTEESLFRIAPA